MEVKYFSHLGLALSVFGDSHPGIPQKTDAGDPLWNVFLNDLVDLKRRHLKFRYE